MDKAKNKQKKLYTKTIIVNTGIIFTLPDFYAHINLFSFKKKTISVFIQAARKPMLLENSVYFYFKNCVFQ